MIQLHDRSREGFIVAGAHTEFKIVDAAHYHHCHGAHTTEFIVTSTKTLELSHTFRAHVVPWRAGFVPRVAEVGGRML